MADLTGQKFGSLVVLKRIPRELGDKGDVKWLCLCECMNRKVAFGSRLRSGVTKHCGCGRVSYRDQTIEKLRASSTRHGHCSHGKTSPEYRSWSSMIQRCTNPNNDRYDDYGGRGIEVCGRWRNSFEAFLVDMGPRPIGHTLGRADNDKDYEPSNCRWESKQQQMANMRSSRLITCQGKTQTLTEWSREVGLNPVTIYKRIDRDGWSVEKALTTPAKLGGPPKLYDCAGLSLSVVEWAELLGISVSGVYWQLDRHGSLNRLVFRRAPHLFEGGG